MFPDLTPLDIQSIGMTQKMTEHYELELKSFHFLNSKLKFIVLSLNMNEGVTILIMKMKYILFLRIH
jgi:hypothetical protein